MFAAGPTNEIWYAPSTAAFTIRYAPPTIHERSVSKFLIFRVESIYLDYLELIDVA